MTGDKEDLIKKLEMPKRLKFLIKISLIKNKEIKSITELEQDFGYATPQPDFREVINFLIKEKYLTLHDRINNNKTKRYKINSEKLADFIDELPAIKLLNEFLDEHHVVVA